MKWIIWLILGIGLALRCSSLGRQSIWLDEAYSIRIAQESFLDLVRSQIQDSSPPLYYLILKIWIRLFGSSEVAVRSLSVVFSFLLILIVYDFVKRLWNEQAALFVALFLAISPTQIFYAQEARMYAMEAFWGVLAIRQLMVTKFDGKHIGPAPAIAAAIWTQNYGWLLWGGILIYSLIKKKLIFRTHIITGLMVFPWFLILIRQIGANTTPWIPKPRWTFFWNTLESYAGRSWNLPLQNHEVWLVQILTAIMAILFLSVLGVPRKYCGNKEKQHDTALFFVLIPLTFAWVLSLLKPMYVPGRYDILFHALFIISVFSYHERMHGIKRIAVVLLILSQVFFLNIYSARYVKSIDRDVVAFLRKSDLCNRVMWITTDLCGTPLSYYLLGESPIIRPFPESEPGWLPGPYLNQDPVFLRNELNKLDSDIIRCSFKHVVAILAGTPSANNSLVNFLDERLYLVMKHHFPQPHAPNQVYEIRLYSK